jgi:thiamine biosynthesis lipoprotein
MVPTSEWTFEAIGTSWWIAIYQPVDAIEKVQSDVAERIEMFDKTYSRFRDDSVVSSIAQKAGDYELPADSQRLLQLYRQLYDASHGLVTPLIGQTLADAGYDAKYSLKVGDVRQPPRWDDVMSYKLNMLSVTQPVLLDFGAAGKGYLVDIVAGILQDHGVTRFCIDAGGDMVCRGLNEPLRIGLENPDNSQQVVGVFQLQDKALCGSAGNRRSWAQYHHIIDPQSLESPRHIKALWVSADNAALADGLATALFFVSPEKLMANFSFAYCMIYADGRIERSSDFPAELFTK